METQGLTQGFSAMVKDDCASIRAMLDFLNTENPSVELCGLAQTAEDKAREAQKITNGKRDVETVLSAFSLSRVGKKVIKDVNTLSAQAAERLIRDKQRHDILQELKTLVRFPAEASEAPDYGEGVQQAIAIDPPFVEMLQAKFKVAGGLITKESEPIKGTISAAAADCMKTVVARMFVQWSDTMQHPEILFANVKNDIALSISISESIADYEAIHALTLPAESEEKSQEQEDQQDSTPLSRVGAFLKAFTQCLQLMEKTMPNQLLNGNLSALPNQALISHAKSCSKVGEQMGFFMSSLKDMMQEVAGAVETTCCDTVMHAMTVLGSKRDTLQKSLAKQLSAVFGESALNNFNLSMEALQGLWSDTGDVDINKLFIN